MGYGLLNEQRKILAAFTREDIKAGKVLLDKQHQHGFAISVTMLAFSIVEAIMYVRSSIPIDASSLS